MFRLNVFLVSCLVLASAVSGRAIVKNGLSSCGNDGNDADKRSHCVAGSKGQVRFISSSTLAPGLGIDILAMY